VGVSRGAGPSDDAGGFATRVEGHTRTIGPFCTEWHSDREGMGWQGAEPRRLTQLRGPVTEKLCDLAIDFAVPRPPSPPKKPPVREDFWVWRLLTRLLGLPHQGRDQRNELLQLKSRFGGLDVVAKSSR
jgi:hypothetical protein